MTDEPIRLGIQTLRANLPSVVDDVADGKVVIVMFHNDPRCAMVPLELLPKRLRPDRRDAKPTKR